jgi:hypothetical protein
VTDPPSGHGVAYIANNYRTVVQKFFHLINILFRYIIEFGNPAMGWRGGQSVNPFYYFDSCSGRSKFTGSFGNGEKNFICQSVKREPFLVDGTMRHSFDVAFRKEHNVSNGMRQFAGQVVMPHLYT